jgi:hypothetical protein
MKRQIAIALWVVCATGTTVFAEGPFGLRMGISRTEIEAATGQALRETSEGRFLYSTKVLPRGSKRFENYQLLIAPGVGLCQVRAVTRPIVAGSMGREVVEGFDELAGILEDLYGPFERRDELAEGSQWTDAVEWMKGLASRERTLAAVWSRRAGARLPEGMESIVLRANARALKEGFFALEYSFQNLERCRGVVLASKREIY